MKIIWRLPEEDPDEQDATRLLGEMWSPDRVARLMDCEPSLIRRLLRRRVDPSARRSCRG